MDTQVLSEALSSAIGDRKVTHLLLTTHDLDPEFFEQEVLPTLLVDDLSHSRRIKELQLSSVIRERDIHIDVFYEGRALAAQEGAARLGWNRIKMTGRGPAKGVFHPKVIVALCHEEGGSRSLLVCTGSANLTRTGWWTNVECIDIATLPVDQRHSYVVGLLSFLKLLRQESAKSAPDAPKPALAELLDVVSRMQGYTHRTEGSRLRPAFLGGYGDFIAELQGLFGDRLAGANLEVITPFLDKEPADAVKTIQALQKYFNPTEIRISLPVRSERTSISEAMYDEVAALERVSWGTLPPGYTKSSETKDQVARTIHAKVYRFWRRAGQGKPALNVTVLGSHNLTRRAHSGADNWEVSVVHEAEHPQGTWLLTTGVAKPLVFEQPDPDAEAESEAEDVPLTISFDWDNECASARWTGPRVEAVKLLQHGIRICDFQAEKGPTLDLGPARSKGLREALLHSCVVRVECRDGRWGYLLVEELNHHLKPDPLDGVELTASEILALWSIPDLRERLKRIAQVRSPQSAGEENLDGLHVPPPASMFDRFAGVFHAFGSLLRTLDEAMESGRSARAAAALYADQLGSPMNLLRLIKGDMEDVDSQPDLELAYVTYACARLLEQRAAQSWPALAKGNSKRRKQLKAALRYEKDLRKRLLTKASDREAMDAFLVWFDAEFAREGADA